MAAAARGGARRFIVPCTCYSSSEEYLGSRGASSNMSVIPDCVKYKQSCLTSFDCVALIACMAAALRRSSADADPDTFELCPCTAKSVRLVCRTWAAHVDERIASIKVAEQFATKSCAFESKWTRLRNILSRPSMPCVSPNSSLTDQPTSKAQTQLISRNSVRGYVDCVPRCTTLMAQAAWRRMPNLCCVSIHSCPLPM